MAKKETNTKSFILRIDSETMSAIEAWAEDEFRSTNGQLQWIIVEALRKAGRLPKKKKAASKKTKEEVDSNQIGGGKKDEVKYLVLCLIYSKMAIRKSGLASLRKSRSIVLQVPGSLNLL